MKIADLTCRLVKIWDVPKYFDTINVTINNTYPGAGRLTLTADSSSWSHYWNTIGEDRTLEQFILDSPVDYLVDKLGNGISSTQHDDSEDSCKDVLQTAVIKLRRDRDISAHEARKIWNEIDDGGSLYTRFSFEGELMICDHIQNVEWKIIPNPRYQRLEYAVIKMREALTQLQEQADEKAITE